MQKKGVAMSIELLPPKPTNLIPQALEAGFNPTYPMCFNGLSRYLRTTPTTAAGIHL